MQSYNNDKFYRIIDNTQSNYANQLKRLTSANKRANFILVYYSIALIIYSLSVKFFPEYFNENVTSYAGIILSIIVLVYSIVNGNSRYSERISSVQDGLNKMKTLKRELGIGKDLSEIKDEYDKIVNKIEVREDIDFYFTIVHLCKQYNLDLFSGKDKKTGDSSLPSEPKDRGEVSVVKSEIRGYLSEIHPILMSFYIFLLYLRHFLLYIAPIFIFVLCIISNFIHVPGCNN